ncbi:MAG TPA: T9SS type A sorting domain-containing protein, partial [Ignavibacteria bacterium]|nr:T9SS type A sorting domain-containing protein [Ignavibacteria bacterium]
DDAIIRTRALEIIADVIANGNSTVIIPTLEIVYSGFDDFFVRTLDTAGNPIAVSNIALSIVGSGSLSANTVSTDITGNSPLVTVTNANNGDVISASDTVQVPGGITYSGFSSVKQLLVLGRTTTAIRTTTTTWGALPVELSSFTASANNRDINLNWSTMTEINNSGFDIERKAISSDNWTMVGNVSGNGTSNVAHSYSYTDRNLSSGIYTYRLKQTDFNGNFEYHNLNGEVIIGVPNSLLLVQNYPNPFNPTTTISFDLPVAGNVSLKVFNTSGKEVATLVNETRSAGYYSVNFNASNLSSGVYYYRLEANGISKVMKMALVK